MAKKTGTPTIWKNAREITRVYQQLGASDLESALGTEFKDCVVAIVNCVVAVLATDDYVLMKDRTGAAGPEDPI